MRRWGNSPGSPVMPNSPWLNSSDVGYFGGAKNANNTEKRRSWRGFIKGGKLAPGEAEAEVRNSQEIRGGLGFGSPFEYPKTAPGPNALPMDPPVQTPRTFAFHRLAGQ